METAVLTVELIFFILATFFMGYMAINHIILDIKERKQRQKLDEAISEFCDKISNAVITCEKENNSSDNKSSKKERKTSEIKNTKIDYENMPIVELYKVARNLKVKGYYKLHKKELIKAIKETEILSE